eukprot:1566976-Pleurochrysis_carterae.AAC.3
MDESSRPRHVVHGRRRRAQRRHREARCRIHALSKDRIAHHLQPLPRRPASQHPRTHHHLFVTGAAAVACVSP